MRNITLSAALALAATAAWSQDFGEGRVDRISQHMGEMSMQMTMPADTAAAPAPVRDTIRFEPFQMLDDLYRSDIVLLMRHGPTDWSMRDAVGVASTDCGNQRVMTPEGRERMVDMGILLAGNGIVPGHIITSEWCRNRQTTEALLEGMSLIDATIPDRIEVEIVPHANLLLSLEGAPTVTRLRQTITDWEGDPNGPLLIVSHFTNIAELTEFNVYEGEALILDPDRANRVLGYLRLRSAQPDVGHFDPSVVPQ